MLPSISLIDWSGNFCKGLVSILMDNSSEQYYFYVINYPDKEKELCLLEMKCLFDEVPHKKFFFSHRNIDPSTSPFIKLRIIVLHTASSIDELVEILKEEEITCDTFKFVRFKTEEESLDYRSWVESATKLGKVISGEVDMSHPSIEFGIIRVGLQWVFGIYEKNLNCWQRHNSKPHTNSNSLETRTARAIVNIAVAYDKKMRIIDPCCGVGTVVLEALSLGMNIIGYELSWIIAHQAKKNITFFGYDDCIVKGDMHLITEVYDVAIIDLPYGLFTSSTYQQQINIITSARNIAKKLVIITSNDMDEEIKRAGFTIADRCKVHKGMFVRYVRVCY